MDFRNPHHSSYPHQNNNESRPAPIPPPPYSRGFQPLSPHEHSGSRATPSYENGRDLPYNPDRGDVSIDMNMASPSLSIGGPFGVATYGQHAAPEGPNHSRPLAKGDTWPPLGSKQEDRFRHHTVDGECLLETQFALPYRVSFVSCRSWIFCSHILGITDPFPRSEPKGQVRGSTKDSSHAEATCTIVCASLRPIL